MPERLYDELADWWPVLSPPEDYADEAGVYLDLLQQGADGPLRRVLELGSGGGHLASHMPDALELVLVDASPAMLAASRRLNPGRAHVQGDMRTLRLGQSFDAVLLHDAVMYMRTEAELRAALDTLFAHCRPGGGALVLPDHVRETFQEGLSVCGGDAPDGRSARLMEWAWDPDPADTTFRVDFSFLLRDADGGMRAVHDPHTQGLFDRPTWRRLFAEAGFTLLEPDVMPGLEIGEVFLARRPKAAPPG
ncbi:MAG: methyltransferase domain-containing protein [Alphaproteobacteria bacterium]|nr:methyltransferase domain-containing protein [Alphaproteobacteria bacterium]